MTLRDEEVSFKSLEEIKNFLLPQLDTLHYQFMMHCMDLIAEAGVDTARFNPLPNCHKINTTGGGIACSYPQCRFSIKFTKVEDKETG